MVGSPNGFDLTASEPVKNSTGGGPPPGLGAHPEEISFWETPIFKKHPLTGKEDAIWGIFFRLWPEHVQILQQMKLDGWPHVEIVRVSKELWNRQLEDHSKNEDLAAQHRDIGHAKRQEDANDIYEPLPGEEDSSDGNKKGEDMAEDSSDFWRAISRTAGPEYRNKVEQFRGRFYSKDGGGMQFTRSRNDSVDQRTRTSVVDLPSFKKSEFSVEIVSAECFQKADTTGGVRELPLYELKRKKDQTWTRKEAGVSNAPSTPSSQEDKEVLP